MILQKVAVVLTDKQQAYANAIGLARNLVNRSVNRKDNRATGFDSAQKDREGASGEYAVSLYTGLPWTNALVSGRDVGKLTKRRAPDIGDNIEVRTRTKHWHELAMHRNDNPELRYVLVLSHQAPTYLIAGWLWGHELAVDENWHGNLPYPAWLGKQKALRPTSTLLEDDLTEKWDETFRGASKTVRTAMFNVQNILGVEDID